MQSPLGPPSKGRWQPMRSQQLRRSGSRSGDTRPRFRRLPQRAVVPGGAAPTSGASSDTSSETSSDAAAAALTAADENSMNPKRHSDDSGGRSRRLQQRHSSCDSETACTSSCAADVRRGSADRCRGSSGGHCGCLVSRSSLVGISFAVAPRLARVLAAPLPAPRRRCCSAGNGSRRCSAVIDCCALAAEGSAAAGGPAAQAAPKSAATAQAASPLQGLAPHRPPFCSAVGLPVPRATLKTVEASMKPPGSRWVPSCY